MLSSRVSKLRAAGDSMSAETDVATAPTAQKIRALVGLDSANIPARASSARAAATGHMPSAVSSKAAASAPAINGKAGSDELSLSMSYCFEYYKQR